MDENYPQEPIVRLYSDRRSDPKKVGECCVAQESSQKAPFLPSTPIKGDSTWRNNTTDYQPSTPQSQTLKPRLLLLILQGKGRQTEPQPAPPYTKPKTLQVTHYYSSLRLLLWPKKLRYRMHQRKSGKVVTKFISTLMRCDAIINFSTGIELIF